MPSVSDQTDQSLLDDFVRHGLESAFAELARRHQAMAFAAAYRICGERGEAQDILQQALLVLARRAGDLGDVRCLSAWLHRVVILEAKKARRTAANRRRRETMAYQINELSSSGQAFSQKIAPELDQSLNAMREKDREVLTLHYLEGQTFQAIARSLGGTAEAWQKRSVRALQKLADKLRSRGVAVSTVALGAFFISARAEAGVSASFLETLTRHALEVSAKDAVVTLGKTAILLSMKTGIAVSLASGVLLAYGWGVVTDHIPNKPWDAGTQARVEESSGEERVMRDPRDRGFTLEMVKLAVDEYERATKSDPLAESRLRSLMFLVPVKYLEDVFQILLATKDHQKFQQAAAALFGRWAELDAATALVRAKEAGDFSYQARRAVMVTWLNQDSEGALKVMLADKSQDNREYLAEFVTYQCERTPQAAALLVDRLAKDWPEIDRPLFELVAKLWARTEPLAAGDWVASSPDSPVKLKLLQELSQSVGKTRGFDGLAIADHVEDPEARSKIRNNVIYWWATTCAAASVIPGKSQPVTDISAGFPADWTAENIRTFAQAAMVNYSKELPDLLKIAKNDEQRILICEGAVKGAGWSNPAAVTGAVEELPDSFVATPQGKETLKVLIRRWNEMDPQGVNAWLSKQLPGPKTDVMWAELKTEGTK